MKKLIIALFTLLGFGSPGFAAEGISPRVIQSFQNAFTDAKDIRWDESHGYSIASFIQNGTKKSAYYDTDGNLVVVGRAITPEELPQMLRNDLQETYAGYSLITLYEMKDETGISYYATVNNGEKLKVIKGNRKQWKTMRTRKA